jgi:tripartite-type tricarboxylate transporter receptor subunit TctC
MNHRRDLLRAAVFTPLASMAPRAMAQAPAFPAKTITLVCPLGAGSSIDVIARIYATKASALLGVPVIVDNKPGAGGAIAAGLVMRAPADGHTLLIASNTYIVAPHVYRKSEYDPLVTFTPVTGLFTTGIVMSARPDFPARTLGEFIALAKANPGKYTYSTWGVGTSAHLQMELLRMRAGIEVLHVPYKSGPEASQATMSGQTDLGFDTVFGVAPRLKAGQLRALTVFAPQRAVVLPDVATNVEQGIPGIEQLGFCGLVGLAGMPRDAIDKLVNASRQVVADPDYAKRIQAFGAEPFMVTPEQLHKFLREEVAKVREVTSKLAISLD